MIGVKNVLNLMGVAWLLFISGNLLSQSVSIQEDPLVTKVVTWYKSVQEQQSEMMGWAVQIINTRDRREMEQARERFRQKYPQYRIRSDYSEPYYRLKVGSFINKLDALALRNELRRDYPTALHINQEINKADFY